MDIVATKNSTTDYFEKSISIIVAYLEGSKFSLAKTASSKLGSVNLSVVSAYLDRFICSSFSARSAAILCKRLSGAFQTVQIPIATRQPQQKISQRNMSTNLSSTMSVNSGVPTLKLFGFIIAVEILSKKNAPAPNPAIIMPEVRPGLSGKNLQASCTAA